MSEVIIVLESSSDEEETISTINTGRPSTPDSQCSICLDELTNPSHTDSCLHSFCFQCLQQWSNVKQFCPLCKETFSSIYHSFDGMGIHETYDVPRQQEIHILGDSLNEHVLRNMLSTLSWLHGLLFSNNGIGQVLYHSISETPITGQAIRIRVYVDNMWAEPLQDITDSMRDYGPAFYRNNPSHVYRLHLFILRDVVAVMESLRLNGQVMIYSGETIVAMSNYIMQSLFVCDIRQLYLINALRTFLGVHLLHFCHELYNFAKSLFEISEYDRTVQYTFRQRSAESTEQLPIETIVLDLDDEEDPRPTIITDLSSSTDDSNVVIPNLSIEPHSSASIDQPSTSTEIRDSLNQPNNSLNEHVLRNMLSTLSWLHGLLFSNNGIGQVLYHSISETPITGQAIRIRVYVDNMWAEPLQDITDSMRDYGPAFYRNNPSHVYRLHLFILRDVVAVMESLRLNGQVMIYSGETIVAMSNYIMQSLFVCDIRQLYLINALRTFLGVHLLHFCHELYNFAKSLFEISEYDRTVQYTFRQRSAESTEQLPIETIVLDLDDEEDPRPTIITDLSSSTDDSNVVIPNLSIEPHSSASIDQPSTSTEIRDSLNQPNNSLQSEDVGSSYYLSHKKIGRPNLDSSSDDGDSIIAIRPSKAAHIKPLDNHIKKFKNKKIKINTNGPGSEIPGTKRNRSYSGSSSTSGETDANFDSYSTDIVL